VFIDYKKQRLVLINKDFHELEKRINYTFKNPVLLYEALSHSSHANEHGTESNERLEFLGDSVLSLVVSSYLYARYKKLGEGDLSKIRASLVSEDALSRFSEKVDLKKFILLGRGEEKRGGRNMPSIIADAFEAVLGAVYLDSGLSSAKEYLMPFLPEDPAAVCLLHNHMKTDYKTAIQEVIQKNPGESLSYHIISEDGPPHDRVFTAEIRLNSNPLAEGVGKTKKAAEQAAAKSALSLMGISF
jgi:ribonuclease-3